MFLISAIATVSDLILSMIYGIRFVKEKEDAPVVASTVTRSGKRAFTSSMTKPARSS